MPKGGEHKEIEEADKKTSKVITYQMPKGGEHWRRSGYPPG